MNVIDLTQNINEKMPVYPGTDKPLLKQATTIQNDGFAEKLLTMFSHTGTHMDSPAHMIEGAHTLDKFDISKFIGQGTIIDCSKSQIINKKIIKDNIKNKKDLDFILFRTGWSSKWNDVCYFDNFPVLDEDAAIFLTTIGLKGIGVDCISIDAVGSQQMKNHMAILKNDMIIVENLCNLEQLLDMDFIFNCFPLKIEDADGSPIRAVGYIEE